VERKKKASQRKGKNGRAFPQRASEKGGIYLTRLEEKKEKRRPLSIIGKAPRRELWSGERTMSGFGYQVQEGGVSTGKTKKSLSKEGTARRPSAMLISQKKKKTEGRFTNR